MSGRERERELLVAVAGVEPEQKTQRYLGRLRARESLPELPAQRAVVRAAVEVNRLEVKGTGGRAGLS